MYVSYCLCFFASRSRIVVEFSAVSLLGGTNCAASGSVAANAVCCGGGGGGCRLCLKAGGGDIAVAEGFYQRNTDMTDPALYPSRFYSGSVNLLSRP